MVVRRPPGVRDIKIYWGAGIYSKKSTLSDLKDESQLAIATDQCSLFVREAVELK